jgi:hypothetical protein
LKISPNPLLRENLTTIVRLIDISTIFFGIRDNYAPHSKRIVLFGYPIMGYQLDDAAGGDCTEGVLDPPASRLFHVGWPTGAKK